MRVIIKKRFLPTISLLLKIFRRGSIERIRYYRNDERIIYHNKELRRPTLLKGLFKRNS